MQKGLYMDGGNKPVRRNKRREE